jgi:hypothetical protein
VEVLEHDSPPNLDWQGARNITYGGFLFPGKSVDIENRRFHFTGEVFNLTDAEIKALQEGSEYVVVYGYTIYSDSFGKHWTRFCAQWHYTPAPSPPKFGYNALSCVALNGVGDGDIPQASQQH